jgi:hypothetical protein
MSAELPPRESWRRAWRMGFAPVLSNAALEALYHALDTGDPRLVQGSTTSPHPLQCVADRPCEAACAIGYAGWIGEHLETVAQVEEYFARICHAAEVLENTSGRDFVPNFLNWFDRTEPAEVRELLMPEIARELRRREQGLRGPATQPSLIERGAS